MALAWIFVTIAVSVVGILLILWSSERIARARNLENTVLLPSQYSKAQINAIRFAVHRRGELPDDPKLHAVALSWAREEATLAPAARRLLPFLFVGTALAMTVLYLVSELFVVVLVIQVVVILLGINTFFGMRRGITRAKELVAKEGE